MKVCQFVLRLEQPLTDSQVRRLFCQTSQVCVETGAFRRWSAVMVDRKAPSLAEAIVATIRDLDLVGLVIIEVGPDEDIVSSSVIAERAQCSVGTVEEWSSGAGGCTGFPEPVDMPGGVTYYRWSDIRRWIQSRGVMSVPETASLFVAVNFTLRLRAVAPHVQGISAITSLLTEIG